MSLTHKKFVCHAGGMARKMIFLNLVLLTSGGSTPGKGMLVLMMMSHYLDAVNECLHCHVPWFV
jgi:hypothetical protein